ncbi:MAG: 3-dehydroquinate synthase [Chitinophagaceae bacterium]
MKTQTFQFATQSTQYYLGEKLENLAQHVKQESTVLLVDSEVNRLHESQLEGWKKIVIPSGESSKDLATFQWIMEELVLLEVDRKHFLVGIGGGVVTDLTGFVSSVFLRGLKFGFVPTTLLAQVDASLGGKNGINLGSYKNMVGTIRQPEFILFDYSLLRSLPEMEWINGFAEIIKYGAILDEELIQFLENNRLAALEGDPQILAFLVERCVDLKSKIVQEDEFEGGIRRILNFGHTLGHAVEKLDRIPHGQAVAIGMVAASKFSENLVNFPASQSKRLVHLIGDYRLPTEFSTDRNAVSQLFKMDKKREKNVIYFILLQKLGHAVTVPIELSQLNELVALL